MKRKTIRSHADFLSPRNGFFVKNSCFSVKARPAKYQDSPRYGIVTSKRLFKLATARNRAKRLLRDWIAYNEDLMMPEFDYVFIADDEVLNCSRDMGRDLMEKAITKISKIYEKYEPKIQ